MSAAPQGLLLTPPEPVAPAEKQDENLAKTSVSSGFSARGRVVSGDATMCKCT